jgi:hypothetical protein
VEGEEEGTRGRDRRRREGRLGEGSKRKKGKGTRGVEEMWERGMKERREGEKFGEGKPPPPTPNPGYAHASCHWSMWFWISVLCSKHTGRSDEKLKQ